MALTVNGEPIPDDLLHAEFGQIKAHYERQGNMSCCERDDEFMGYAKDNLIARALLTQESRKRIPAPDDSEIDAAIGRAIEEQGGKEQFYFNLGISPGEEDKLRPEASDSLRLDRLIEEVTGGDREPSDEELQSYYEAHQDEYMTPVEVRASHIFKSVDRVEEREKILMELTQLRTRARNGDDFEQLAREHSDKPEDEIDLGFYKRGELMDEFEILTFSMDVGEISPAFATPFGLHLAKVTGRKEAEPIPFDSCREEVTEALLHEKKQEKLKAHVDELKKDATIEETEEEHE